MMLFVYYITYQLPAPLFCRCRCGNIQVLSLLSFIVIKIGVASCQFFRVRKGVWQAAVDMVDRYRCDIISFGMMDSRTLAYGRHKWTSIYNDGDNAR